MILSAEAAKFGLQFSIISKTPNVLLIGMDIGNTGFQIFADGTNSLEALCQILGDQSYLFINPWWSLTDSEAWSSRLTTLGKLLKTHPNIEFCFFCNSPCEVQYLGGLGFKAILMNHNVFANEHINSVMDSTKDFSAIYNAKLVPWKRHWLAAKVKNLGLMYSKFGELESYYPKVKEFLPEAHFLNGDPTTADYQMFNHKQVAENLNRARVGLCLSKIEGAMYASIEYLLCGLPIVSTRSEGGRDLFFDEEYCAIVDDDPLAISNAVQRLESMSIDPRYIRKRTMDKILKFRASFVDLVNEIKRRHGLKEDGNHVLQSITSGDWACWRYSTLQYLHAFFSNDERLTI